MKTASILAVTALCGVVSAAPGHVRRDTFCGQWDYEVAGPYTVYNNLWGQDSADSGSQCTTNNGLTDGTLSWSTEWSWSGGEYQVKSYANVVVETDRVPLSDISSIQSEWDWSYTADGEFVANVAFDMFTGDTADGSEVYEFMIWLGAFGGAGPISSTGSPIATVTLAGSSWDLYQGMNGQMTVFSFVSSSGNVQSFSGDLIEFIDYLVAQQGVSDSQILHSIGGGTEPFVGSGAVMTTSSYSVSVS